MAESPSAPLARSTKWQKTHRRRWREERNGKKPIGAVGAKSEMTKNPSAPLARRAKWQKTHRQQYKTN
jgi:hypothetical protein